MYGEANQVADRLAKLGASSGKDWSWWDSPPAALHSLLLGDQVGVVHLR